ncbi:MAG TPA: undecaprenyl-phosphate glucose phosphotransferase [Rhizobiales bacterium]|nr:undecaprenyl-phosphate glucose phosphotransferase [Hyphomicrobiales bacterium]
MLSGLVHILETLIITLAGLTVFYLYVLPEPGLTGQVYIVSAMATGVLGGTVFRYLKLYELPALRRPVISSLRMLLALTGTFALLTLLAFLFKMGAEFSRVWLVSWFAASASLLLILRMIMAALVSKWTRDGHLERRAVIVGGGPRASALIRALNESGDTGIRITGIFDDRNDERTPPELDGLPKLGTLRELIPFARKTRVDLLILTLPLSAEKRLLQILKMLWVLPSDIRLSAVSDKLHFLPRAYSHIGNVPFLDLYDKPLTDWNYVLKTIEDRVLGLGLLILAAPLMALIALMVKLDSPGPVLFRQKRFGFNNQLVEVWKFRSMYVEKTDLNGATLTRPDDDRITRVGRFIRKTSLDELPQLVNVVMGSLSLVGPRPHAVLASSQNHLYEEIVDSYYARHRIKPGVTGWAQINGLRGETDTIEKIRRRTEYDLYYIERWSILFDLYILLMTPLALLNQENAY